MSTESPPVAPTPSTPGLAVAAPRGQTRAVVLVLHGGRAVSEEPASWRQLSPLRMVPFARAVVRHTRGQGVAVWRVRYRVRGWNGAQRSPVADVRWALDEVRRRHGDVPVVLLGHSMGGRTAVHVLDDPSVRGAVLLAPWLTAGEPVQPARGRRVAVLHGDDDRITSAEASRAWADRAGRAGARVSYVLVEGGEHFLVRHARQWHRLACDAVVDALAGTVEPPAGG